MLAYIFLLLTLATRLLPPVFHVTGLNLTSVGACLLFFGSRRPRWQCGIAVAALAMTDYLLTAQVYGLSFHAGSYLVTWLWYGVVCLGAHHGLRKVTVLRVVTAALASSTSFFLLSNLVVWTGSMYAHTAGGFVACYTAALPFYRNDVLSTLVAAALFFGCWAAYTRYVSVRHDRLAATAV